MLPGTDGLEILRMIRDDASMKTLPVMMLTAKGTEYDTVCGLDAGADDYLAKPFGMMELVSRVNALLRRAHAPAAEDAGDVLASGPIVLTSSAHTVTVDGEPVALTLKEFDLLRALMANEGRVLSRSQLLEEVWGVTYVGETRTVDVHIQTLRQKLARVREGVDALITTVLSRSQLLEEVWGVTYVGETRTVDVHIQTLRQKLARVREGVDALITTVRGVGYCFKAAL